MVFQHRDGLRRARVEPRCTDVQDERLLTEADPSRSLCSAAKDKKKALTKKNNVQGKARGKGGGGGKSHGGGGSRGGNAVQGRR